MREKQWITISPEAKDLVYRMLEVDAEQRVTVEEALAHPWIKVGYSCGSWKKGRQLLWYSETVV